MSYLNSINISNNRIGKDGMIEFSKKLKYLHNLKK